MARHLRHDMGRSAKAINAEPRRLSRHRHARHLERAVADQPSTEQRRGLGVAVTFGNWKNVARVGNGVLGIAAVDLVAGKARVVAKVLAARAAVEANAIGEAEPRHANALADGEASHLVADSLDTPHDLVTQYERKLWMREIAI